MERIILKAIIKDFFNKNTKLLICTITYYTILALIPSIIAITMILNTLKIDVIPTLPKEFLTIKTGFSTLTIFIISLYFIGRIFYVLVNKKRTNNQLFLSSILALISIAFTMLFLFTFFIEIDLIKFIIQSALISFILTSINCFSLRNFSISSFIISSLFSLIIMVFFHFFLLLSKDFINLDNYYGFLGPFFMSILVIHIVVNIAYLSFSTAKAYSTFSSIKFIKR